MTPKEALLRAWSAIKSVAGVALPHVLWISGAFLIADAYFGWGWHQSLGEEPTATLVVIGFAMFSVGRAAVSERRLRKKYKKRADRYERLYEELQDTRGQTNDPMFIAWWLVLLIVLNFLVGVF